MCLLVNTQFSLGDLIKSHLLTPDQAQILQYYQLAFPDANVISHNTESHLTEPNYIISRGYTHKHLVLDGRCIIPSESLTDARSSIIQADYDGVRFVGQIVKIISHEQPRISRHQHFASVRWFKRLEGFDISQWDA